MTCRDTDDPGASLAFPVWDSLCSWQLLIFSVAARAVLTRPAALSVVAHVMSSGTICSAVSLGKTLQALRLSGGPSMDPTCTLCQHTMQLQCINSGVMSLCSRAYEKHFKCAGQWSYAAHSDGRIVHE